MDPHLVEAGNQAVAEGRVESLSAWVNQALAERAAKERRLAALAGAIASDEAAFGAITPDEIAVQVRADRAAARVVRGVGLRPPRARRRRPRT